MKLVSSSFKNDKNTAQKLTELQEKWDDILTVSKNWNLNLQTDVLDSNDIGLTLNEVEQNVNLNTKLRNELEMSMLKSSDVDLQESYSKMKLIRSSCIVQENKVFIYDFFLNL